MVTRQTQPEDGRNQTEESLRNTLSERTREANELRARLAAMEAEGGRFLSSASHAVKNPLTVIQSYLEILHTDLSDGLSDQQLSFLGIAYDNVMRLSDLVEDLADIAALETHNAQIELASVDAGDLVREICCEIEPAVRRGQLSLAVETGETEATVLVDAHHFKDALQRILENAVRFTDRGGNITVGVHLDGDEIVVEVADTGAGIAGDSLDEIFEAFVQLHRKPGEQREGYGLGLSIARRLIEAFGGTLTVASTPGVGSTFAIRLPKHVGSD